MVFLRESNSDLVPFYRNPYHGVSSNSQQVQQRHLKQVQPRHLIYASRSFREGVANACTESTMCPKTNRLKGNASGRRRDRTSTSSLPRWAVSAQVDRARGARGPLTLRGADDEGRGLKGSNKQRGLVLFYVCNRLKENSGWVPEREHTAQNGKWKLLDVR